MSGVCAGQLYVPGTSLLWLSHRFVPANIDKFGAFKMTRLSSLIPLVSYNNSCCAFERVNYRTLAHAYCKSVFK